jgi:hypothetical protein
MTTDHLSNFDRAESIHKFVHKFRDTIRIIFYCLQLNKTLDCFLRFNIRSVEHNNGLIDLSLDQLPLSYMAGKAERLHFFANVI